MHNVREGGSHSLKTEVNVFRADSGRSIVHLPLVGRAFTVGDKVPFVIESLKSGKKLGDDIATQKIVAQLKEMGVVGDQENGVPRTSMGLPFRPTEATLIFTETCNLACTYCYASAHAGKSSPMSERIMRAAVNYVCANAAETEACTPSFRYIGGGEPTTEWRLIEETTDYIHTVTQRNGLTPYIRLITNGTLLTPERINWLLHNIQFVTLSFDILPELQASRSYCNGASTHGKLMDVVRALSAAGMKFHLRTTISTQGASRLKEMVQYVHNNCDAKSIRFEPMSEIGRSVDGDDEKPTDAVFVDSFKAAYRHGRRLGIDVTCKMFTNLVRRNSRFCDVEFAVTPEGIVSGCHRYSRTEHDGFDLFKIGEFDGKCFQIDLAQVRALRGIEVHHFEQCSNCIAKWNCASGCLSARVQGNQISEQGPLCELTRELLKFSIDEKIGGTNDVE